MASQKKIVEMIMIIKTVYPYYAKDTNAEMLVKTWTALLKEYPDEVFERAMKIALQRCKVPPTPADVIEIVKEARRSTEQTDQELWAIYHEALRKVLRHVNCFHYNYIDHTGISQGEQARRAVTTIWNGLPEKIRTYLATESELIRRARDLNFEEISFEQNRFFKTIPVIEKRMEHSALFLDGNGIRMMIE